MLEMNTRRVSFIAVWFCMFACVQVALAQSPALRWQRSLGGSDDEEAAGICTLPDGGCLVVGWTGSRDGQITLRRGNLDSSDCWVARLDSTGALKSQLTFGGSNSDEARAITRVSDGNFVIVGTTWSRDYDVPSNHFIDTAHPTSDVWVVKYDGSGMILWSKVYGGTMDDEARAVAATPDGGVIVAGSSRSTDGDVHGHAGGASRDVWVLKLSSNGTLEWEQSFGGSNNDEAFGVAVTQSGKYMVAGVTMSNDLLVQDHHGAAGSGDAWVLCLDNTGGLKWNKCYGGTRDDVASSIAECRDHGFVVAGTTSSTDGDAKDYHGNGADGLLFKIDTVGYVQWSHALGGTLDDEAHAVTATPDGGCTVAGVAHSVDGDVTFNHGAPDAWLLKYDGYGNVLWDKSLGGSDWDEARAIALRADGGYAVAASARSTDGDVTGNHGRSDFWISCLAPDTASIMCTYYMEIANVVPWVASDSVVIGASDPSLPAHPPAKICADGSAATVVRVACLQGGLPGTQQDLEFRIKEFTDTAHCGWFDAPAMSFDRLLCTYHHPRVVDSTKLFTALTMQVIDTALHAVVVEYPIEIYRAPVVFVHGFASTPASFQALADHVVHTVHCYPVATGLDSTMSGSDSPLITFADYSQMVNDALHYNAWMMPSATTHALEIARGLGYSAGKVDVVAHSLGAILARLYIQSAGFSNEINRFISVNAPHAGTQLATWGYRHRGNLDGSLAPVRDWFLRIGLDMNGDVMQDLDVESSAIRNDLNGASLNAHVVPTFVLTSMAHADAPSFDPGSALLKFIASYEGIPSVVTLADTLFGRDGNDLVVPVASQRGGVSQNGYVQSYSDAQSHFATDAPALLNAVTTALGQDPAKVAIMTGFHPPVLSYALGAARKTEGHAIQSMPATSLKISSPPNGAVVNPGDTITIDVQGSGPVPRFAVFMANSEQGVGSAMVNSGSGQVKYVVPRNSFGHVGVLAVSADTANVYGIDSVTYGVRVSVTLITAAPFPKRVFVRPGDTATFVLRGTFADSLTRNVTEDTAFTMTVNDPSVAKITGPGRIAGLRQDTTSITITRGTLTTTLFVTVGDPVETSPVRERRATAPDVRALGPVYIYPNPAHELSRAGITLAAAARVRMYVTDVLGNIVAVIADGRMDAGYHEMAVPTQELRNGVYFCVLAAGGEMRRQTMVVMK